MKHASGFHLLVLALALLLPASARADEQSERGRTGRTAQVRGGDERDDRYDDEDRGDRARDDDRWDDDDDRHDDDRNRNARSVDRRGGDGDSRIVRELARDLEALTRSIYREVVRADDRRRGGSDDRSSRERRALSDLDRLQDRARQFRREVNRSSRDLRASDNEFDSLYGAWIDASDTLRVLRPDRELRTLHRRIDHTMEELVEYYGGDARYAHWRDRRRDDRDWDRNRDDDWDDERHRPTGSRHDDDDRYDDRDDDGAAHRRRGDDD